MLHVIQSSQEVLSLETMGERKKQHSLKYVSILVSVSMDT